MLVPVGDIKVRARHRKDLGDLDALASSIVNTGTPSPKELNQMLCVSDRARLGDLIRRKMMLGGVVYFIEARPSGLIKIGFSSDVSRRLKQLQTANSEQLTLLSVAPGSRADEADLHTKFKHCHSHREWFRPDASLLGFISSLGAKQ